MCTLSSSSSSSSSSRLFVFDVRRRIKTEEAKCAAEAKAAALAAAAAEVLRRESDAAAAAATKARLPASVPTQRDGLRDDVRAHLWGGTRERERSDVRVDEELAASRSRKKKGASLGSR